MKYSLQPSRETKSGSALKAEFVKASEILSLNQKKGLNKVEFKIRFIYTLG